MVFFHQKKKEENVGVFVFGICRRSVWVSVSGKRIVGTLWRSLQVLVGRETSTSRESSGFRRFF